MLQLGHYTTALVLRIVELLATGTLLLVSLVLVGLGIRLWVVPVCCRLLGE